MYPILCTVSLLYLMVLKTISPGCGVQASPMLFLPCYFSCQNRIGELVIIASFGSYAFVCVLAVARGRRIRVAGYIYNVQHL